MECLVTEHQDTSVLTPPPTRVIIQKNMAQIIYFLFLKMLFNANVSIDNCARNRAFCNQLDFILDGKTVPIFFYWICSFLSVVCFCNSVIIRWLNVQLSRSSVIVNYCGWFENSHWNDAWNFLCSEMKNRSSQITFVGRRLFRKLFNMHQQQRHDKEKDD